MYLSHGVASKNLDLSGVTDPHLVGRTADVVVPRDDPFHRVSDEVHVDRVHHLRIELREVEEVEVLQEGAALVKEQSSTDSCNVLRS